MFLERRTQERVCYWCEKAGRHAQKYTHASEDCRWDRSNEYHRTINRPTYHKCAGIADTNKSNTCDPELVPPEEISKILEEFKDVFEDMPPGLPPDRGVGHTIVLEPGVKPTHSRPYRLSEKEKEEVKRQVTDFLARGLIEPSNSPYGAPVLFVQKPDGSLRMCIDYRALNKGTIRDGYPMPRIDDLFDALAKCKVFSSLDLQSGYHQIRITESDRPKTAFVTHEGQFQFKVLCFGLTNAPATFQRVMNTIFRPHIGKFVLIYIDDILIMSQSPKEHLVHLRQVLELLRKNKLYAKLSKCELNKPELRFLGHIVGKDGIKVDPAKISVVQNWPQPQSLKELQGFLGLSNYFRRFIKDYSTVVAPLTDMTKTVGSTVNWLKWEEAQINAFNKVKHALTSAPVLALPNPDLPYTVVTDASLAGTGGVLMQDGRVISYTSKKFTPAEKRYTTGEQELLGIIHAAREWRCYLEGPVKVTLLTDHKPLLALKTQTKLSNRQARWMEFLSRFNFDIASVKGTKNMADPISRSPLLTRENAEMERVDPKAKVPTTLPRIPLQKMSMHI